jgi:2-polyprenyl-3-methyl-5-hydroxy-6-metoxy-1,4-benzoquinol methylase
MNCTICKSSNTKLAFMKNEYKILHCADCDHLYTSVELTHQGVEDIYSDSYFNGGGHGYDDYTVEKDMLISRGEYYADKISKYTGTGNVLDIGAAAGFILKGFENKGWKGKGIEPNQTMAEYGKNTLGIDIKKGTFQCIKLEENFDLILMIQVVAHLNNLNNSINKVYNCLKPGGYLLIETWNKDSMIAKLFGKNWHEYCPPSTLHYFSKKTLKNLLAKHNFEIVAQGRPKKHIHSKHAKSILRHKFNEIPALKWMTGITNLIPDNRLLPYPSEDLFWYLLKKTD